MPKYHLLSMNAKLAKSIAEFGADIVCAGLSFAPGRRSGREVCPNKGACYKLCNLWFSGRTVTDAVRAAALRRTQLFFRDPVTFWALLREDLDKLQALADLENKTAYARLDTASDLGLDLQAAEEYPKMRFYGYSKIKGKCDAYAKGELPVNVSVTPSFHERLHPNTVRAYLRRGCNIAVCFDTAYLPQVGRIDPLPTTWRGYPVIDGDKHDLRHEDFDGRGNIVGLRFKGSRKIMPWGIDKGFVQRGIDS